jgi:O-antigen/teichoic acid export membrane protein
MKLVKNFISLAGAEVASKLVTFAAFASLARVAGPDGFGHLEFAGTALFCAALLVEQGFGPYGAREIAKAPQHTARLVTEIVLARVFLAVIAYFILITLALSLDREPTTQLLLIYGASLLAMPLLLQWVFQGHDQMPVVAAIQIIRQTIFAAVVFIFVRGSGQIMLAAVAEIAGVCGAAVFGLWIYRRRFGRINFGRLSISARLFREGVPIGLSQMFWVARIFGATLILGFIATAGDVGHFAGALRILVAAHTFVWLYYFNLLPSLARAWQRGQTDFAELVNRSLRGVVWMALAGGLIWVVVAPAVMTSIYGSAFAPAGSTLQLLAGVCVAAALSGHYRFGLIAAGRQNAEMMVSALGAVVAAISIPFGHNKIGLHGAAIGVLVAETVVWLAAWWCGRRMLGLRGHMNLLLRPLLAVSLVSALLRSLPVHSRVLQVVVALSLMIALMLALDGELRQQSRLLAMSLRRRFSRDLLGATR